VLTTASLFAFAGRLRYTPDHGTNSSYEFTTVWCLSILTIIVVKRLAFFSFQQVVCVSESGESNEQVLS
jgi:hypothetical protein